MADCALAAHDDFTSFCKFTMPSPSAVTDPTKTRLLEAEHQLIMDAHLMKVESGEIPYSVITMPPRHGKSERASRRFIPWFIGRNPWAQVIFTTYGQEFADDFGRTWREIITGERYQMVFPELRIKMDSRAVDHLGIKEFGGELFAVGMGGALTGRGADLLVIDDPIKGPKEADSATIREQQWQWYTAVALTRLMPGARIVIVLTRWSEDDIVGRLFNELYIPKEEQEKWTVLHMPAIANEGTTQEKALWPDRYTLQYLQSIRRVSPARVWSSLWQGTPTPPEGFFFKVNQIFEYTPDQMPKEYRGYLTGDLALGTKKQNDHTCAGKWMLDKHGNLYLHPNLFWEKKLADECVEALCDFMVFHKKDLMCGWWEKGQIAKAVGPFLFKRMRERRIAVPVLTLPSQLDKGRKAASIHGRMAMGSVFFPRWAPWWPRAKDQLLKFTGSGDDPEDDFVDMCSLIGQALGMQVTPGEEQVPGPKVAQFSLAWLKRETERQEERDRVARELGGM